MTENEHDLSFWGALVEAAPFGMVVADEAGRMALVNSRVVDLFGWSREELLGQPVEMLLPASARRSHVQRRAEYAKDGSPRLMGQGRDLKGVRKDGSLFDVEVGLSPFRTPEGNYVIASVADITERREAEMDARRLASIVRSSEDAIIGYDLDGIVTSWNRGAESLYGYKEEDTVGESIRRIIPASCEQEFEAFMKAVRRGETIESLETERVRDDGRTLKVSLTVSPISDAFGNRVGASTIARDITRRKRMEELQRSMTEKLAQANRRLERQNEELSSFAYITSHDLQEPLRSITSFLQLLRETKGHLLDDEAREYIAFAVNGAGRLKEMIVSLLAYNRLDRAEGERSRFGLRAAAARAIDSLRALIEENGAVVEMDGADCEMLGHPTQFSQLFQNLVANAIKYRSAAAPHVIIRCSLAWGSEISERLNPDARYVFVSVRDNGMGIHPNYHQRIFEVFQSLHPHSKYGGTGIGLAICRKVVERHGGLIWVESEEGQGSDFKIALPAIPLEVSSVQAI